MPLFGHFDGEINDVLNELILERIFSGSTKVFATWQEVKPATAHMLWEISTSNVKLSEFAEEFFRRLADRLGHPMLLRKGELHRLIEFVDPATIPDEVTEKLDFVG